MHFQDAEYMRYGMGQGSGTYQSPWGHAEEPEEEAKRIKSFRIHQSEYEGSHGPPKYLHHTLHGKQAQFGGGGDKGVGTLRKKNRSTAGKGEAF